VLTNLWRSKAINLKHEEKEQPEAAHGPKKLPRVSKRSRGTSSVMQR
jgi:hypothetical protein